MECFPEEFTFENMPCPIREDAKLFRAHVYKTIMSQASKNFTYACVSFEYMTYCLSSIWIVLRELKDRFPEICLFVEGVGHVELDWDDRESLFKAKEFLVKIHNK